MKEQKSTAGKGLIIAALIISALATGFAAWQTSKVSDFTEEGLKQLDNMENTDIE